MNQAALHGQYRDGQRAARRYAAWGLRRERIVRPRANILAMYDDVSLYERFRFDRGGICYLVEKLSPRISPSCARFYVIDPVVQVSATLHYLATGSFQLVVGDITGISQPSVSRIVHHCISAIVGLLSTDFLVFPTTLSKIAAAKQTFLDMSCKIPNVFFQWLMECKLKLKDRQKMKRHICLQERLPQP